MHNRIIYIHFNLWIVHKITYYAVIDALPARVIFECYNKVYFHKTRKQSSNMRAAFLYITQYTLGMYKELLTQGSWYNIDIIETTEAPISTIEKATKQNIKDIIRLRGLTEVWNLRPLSHTEIGKNIQEFYIAAVNNKIVGCCRIMESHHIYELGSLVSSQKWVGNELITFAEGFAQTEGALIMAVTRSNILSFILNNRNWMHANDLYPDRLRESTTGSELWLHL